MTKRHFIFFFFSFIFTQIIFSSITKTVKNILKIKKKKKKKKKNTPPTPAFRTSPLPTLQPPPLDPRKIK